MRSQHMRMSKKFQNSASEKLDEFSPCFVINWGPGEKGESGYPEEWKKAKDKSAEPTREVPTSRQVGV